MPEKLSAVEVLSRLVERVRQIERQAAQVAAVMERMIAAAERTRVSHADKQAVNSAGVRV